MVKMVSLDPLVNQDLMVNLVYRDQLDQMGDLEIRVLRETRVLRDKRELRVRKDQMVFLDRLDKRVIPDREGTLDPPVLLGL